MKKVVVVVAALLIAAFSFWAGGRFGNAPSAHIPDEPTYSDVAEGTGSDAASRSPGAVQITPARRQLIGVKVAAVEKKSVTYTLRLYGRVVPDETKTYRVNASTDCWIRQLSDVTTGSIVRKDQILGEALAPAYYNSQLTYLIALDNIDRIRQQLGGQLRHQQTDLANNQIRVAVQALQNLGITDAQTEELANTRRARPYLQVRSPADGVVLSRNITLNQWFKAADEFYTIADIGKVWVYADVYEDEAMHMRPGMAVTVRHAQMGQTFDADVGEVLPLFDPAARTSRCASMWTIRAMTCGPTCSSMSRSRSPCRRPSTCRPTPSSMRGRGPSSMWTRAAALSNPAGWPPAGGSADGWRSHGGFCPGRRSPFRAIFSSTPRAGWNWPPWGRRPG